MATIKATCAFCLAQPSLSAAAYIRTLQGATQAHLMRASDGLLHAVKFQNNPHNSRTLASEYLATRLGLWLGLPMPQVAVIDVPESLVNQSLLRIETDDRLTRCASGRQLAIRYIHDAETKMPRNPARHVFNWFDILRVLPFDKWTGNCDHRQVMFAKHDGTRYRLTFVDQHQCFDRDRWQFPDLPGHGLYEHLRVYRGMDSWTCFQPTLSRIENINPFDIWKFAMEIPPEWYGHDSEAVSSLIEALFTRRRLVRQLVTEGLKYAKKHKTSRII